MNEKKTGGDGEFLPTDMRADKLEQAFSAYPPEMHLAGAAMPSDFAATMNVIINLPSLLGMMEDLLEYAEVHLEEFTEYTETKLCSEHAEQGISKDAVQQSIEVARSVITRYLDEQVRPGHEHHEH